MAETQTNLPRKSNVAHIETTPDETVISKVNDYNPDELVKSKFDALSIGRTVWVFRRVILVALAVYTGYVCEGFEVSKAPPRRPPGSQL